MKLSSALRSRGALSFPAFESKRPRGCPEHRVQRDAQAGHLPQQPARSPTVDVDACAAEGVHALSPVALPPALVRAVSRARQEAKDACDGVRHRSRASEQWRYVRKGVAHVYAFKPGLRITLEIVLQRQWKALKGYALGKIAWGSGDIPALPDETEGPFVLPREPFVNSKRFMASGAHRWMRLIPPERGPRLDAEWPSHITTLYRSAEFTLVSANLQSAHGVARAARRPLLPDLDDTAHVRFRARARYQELGCDLRSGPLGHREVENDSSAIARW